jgi:hypothetical protein
MVELHEHQKLALSRLKNGAVLTGDVGSGKSLVAVAYYAEHEAPRPIVVITTAKKRDSLDWEAEFIRYGVGTQSGATTAGVLTVDSWNNLHLYRDRIDCFFIFDEQRVVGSGEWTKNFLSIVSSNRWVLLSATPGDNWLDYIPVFVANGFYKNRTEFLREHVVFTRYAKFPKVDRYVGVNRLVKQRNQILVPMPFVRTTERVVRTITVDHDTIQFERVLKDRWNVFENRPLRDVAELFSAMRKVVNSDSSRIEEVRGLAMKHPRLIVFYNFDYELEKLRTLIADPLKSSSDSSSCPTSDESSGPSEQSEPTLQPAGTSSSGTSPFRDAVRSSTVSAAKRKRRRESSTSTSTTEKTTFQLAEWNGHVHQAVPTSDRWVYLVQYQAGAEGWNCITTDAMVFYSLTYSYKNWHQAFGRIDRLNTPFTLLNYYVFMSNSVIDKAIWKALEGKKSFNERSFLGRIKDTPSQKTVFRD